MKDTLKNIGDRITAKSRKEAEEQRLREERLKELEESQRQDRSIIPHPIKAMRTKKEAATLRKEIEAYKQKKSSNAMLVGCGIVLVIVFVILGVLASGEKQTGDPQSDPSLIAEATPSPTESPSDALQEPAETSDVSTTIAPTDPPSEAPTVQPTPVATDAPETPAPTPTVDPTPVVTEAMPSAAPTEAQSDFLSVSDLEAYRTREYYHVDGTSDILGQNETATITVQSDKPIAEGDVVLLFDEEMISISLVSQSDHEVVYNVKGIKPGTSDVQIVSLPEYIATDGECGCLEFSVWQLDAVEGRVVYVTQTGSKYHYSASCAGVNAITTTYHDAMAYELEPCGICVP